MPVPTAYTEAQLAAFMHDQLGEVGLILGFTAPSGQVGSYQEAIYAALFEYGVSNVSNASDIRKIRALARKAAIEKAMMSLAGRYTFRTGDKTFNRREMQQMLAPMLESARTECLEFDVNNTVAIDKITWRDDPYAYLPDEVRTA